MGTFQEGYEYFSKSVGALKAGFGGKAYVDSINAEIEKLTKDLNHMEGYKTAIDKLKGDAAEFWHGGTFNIDAAVKGSKNRAIVDRSHGLASPDVRLASGEQFGSKYDATAKKTAIEQAKSFFERYKKYEGDCKRNGITPPSYEEYLRKNGIDPNSVTPYDPIYAGQYRLVATDQFKEIEKYLKEKIATEQAIRPEQAKRYQDALKMLKDKLEDVDGNKSIPLKKQEAEELARLAKEGNFDPADWGLTTETLVNWDYIKTQSIQAGLSAAAITVALKTAPEIIKGIRYLIETGEVDPEQLKKIGLTALSSSAEGFLRGMVSASITIACKAGLWGEALKAVSPTMVGGIVVFALDAAKGGFEVLVNKKDSQQFKEEMAEEAFSTIGAAVAGATFSTIIPGIGYVVGSLIGSMLGSYTYHIVTKTTAADMTVSYFRHQAQLFEQYAAKLFAIDLDAFQDTTATYSSVVDQVCAAKDEKELNTVLKEVYRTLDLAFPWQGDFDTFMNGNGHLVFE